MTELPKMEVIAEEVSRELTYARVRNSSAYIGTAVHYPNGTGIVVRIDQTGRDRYRVSDDGYAGFLAGSMHAAASFSKIAADVARRSGVLFEGKTLFVEQVNRSALAGAVAAVATASSRAAERTAYAVDQFRARQSRDLFDARLTDAFGKAVDFDVAVRGATNREWEFDAGVHEASGSFSALFALVAPAFSAVAAANMKIADVRGLTDAPRVTVALVDYDRTEPSLRSILSITADQVIAANDDVARYRLSAAAGVR